MKESLELLEDKETIETVMKEVLESVDENRPPRGDGGLCGGAE